MRHNALVVQRISRIVQIGCGGTGSILAEHLCRMIAGFRLDCALMVIDGDTVERSNIWRQNFAAHEIGQNKAEALAFRLTGRFGITVESFNRFVSRSAVPLQRREFTLVITATDTLASRRIVAEKAVGLWLDVGNGKDFGQAVIGNTHTAADLRRVYRTWHQAKGYISAVPDIAAVNPGVLRARRPHRRAGCGQMPFAEQGFGINAMAALAASVLAKQAVVDGVIATAAIYFDTAGGRMSPRLIDRDLYRPWMRKEN